MNRAFYTTYHELHWKVKLYFKGRIFAPFFNYSCQIPNFEPLSTLDISKHYNKYSNVFVRWKVNEKKDDVPSYIHLTELSDKQSP